MMKIYITALLCIVLQFFVVGDTTIPILCAGMIADFNDCFLGKSLPDQLINRWKWGDIKMAYAFEFNYSSSKHTNNGCVLVACPFTVSRSFTNCVDFAASNKISFADVRDRPYLSFGINHCMTNTKRILTFVYCSKQRDIYPYFINILGVREPSFEEAIKKHPSQCWHTKVYHKQSFIPSHVDDQFVQWDILNPCVNIVFCFNQQKCIGVMMSLKSDTISVFMKPTRYRQADTLDLSGLTQNFKWVPEHQIERFGREISNYLLKANPKPSDGHYRRMLARFFNGKMEQYEVNNTFFKKVNFSHLGSLRTPMLQDLEAPWTSFNYYKSICGAVTLRSSDAEGVAFFNVERLDSFVLNIEMIAEDTQVILPNGIDVGSSLYSYPTNNILYEHLRADGRERIIVQPNIASLYVDGKLNKILVCHDKSGPADHGWSLVRKYYCYEEMPEYFWPVQNAYAPLEESTQD